MSIDSAAFRIDVLLCFQRAPWDLVTPGLRTVSPTYPLIEARFIYEAFSDAERLLAAEAEASVVADVAPAPLMSGLSCGGADLPVAGTDGRRGMGVPAA
ncbi:hypothetical protein ACWF0M_26290 [Kribbella sp. NPDC055110]